MIGHTRPERIRSDIIKEKVGVVPIVENMAESHMCVVWTCVEKIHTITCGESRLD